MQLLGFANNFFYFVLSFLLCSTGAVAFLDGLGMIILCLRERSMSELLELELKSSLTLIVLYLYMIRTFRWSHCRHSYRCNTWGSSCSWHHFRCHSKEEVEKC